jgi:hypothetical protein
MKINRLRFSILLVFYIYVYSLQLYAENFHFGVVSIITSNKIIPVPYSKVILLDSLECIETYTNDKGEFLLFSENSIDYPFLVFIQSRGYIPKLAFINEKNDLNINITPVQDYYRNTLFGPTPPNDTNYRITTTIFDSDSKKPIIGAIAYIVDFPYFSISNSNGDIRVKIPEIDLFQIYNSDIIWLIIEHKGYITHVEEIMKSCFINNKICKIEGIYMNKIENTITDSLFKEVSTLKDSINACNIKLSLLQDSLLSKQSYLINKLDSAFLLDSQKFNSFQRKHFDTLFNKQYFDTISYINKNVRILTNQDFTQALFDTLSILNSSMDSIKSTTTELKNSYLMTDQIPDGNIRFFCGFNYGFIHRPVGSIFLKAGVKFNLNDFTKNKNDANERFYFDLNCVLNTIDTTQDFKISFDQINFNFTYRLINRKIPYYSLDFGAGPSWGARFDSNHNREKNSFGANIELKLIGRIIKEKNAKRNLGKNTFFYLNISNRFVFGGEEYNYWLPLYGAGILFNLY